MTDYAAATLEELWSYDRLVERRLSYGQARTDEAGIVATDRCDPSLVERCEQAMSDARGRCEALHRRIVVEATSDTVLTTIILRDSGYSVVTDPEHFALDHEFLRSIATMPVEAPAIDVRREPVVWRGGTAAVLLHEAFGHPLEHGQPGIEWPSWLHVEVPLALRRASFRHVPLRRMTQLVARQNGASLAWPERRVEILLIDGGSYDPLTERVTLRVSAADLVQGLDSQRLPPFTLSRTRREIASALAGAEGEPLRYPGVICSREGQELFVPSAAPVMLTVFR